jgi:glycosyltransferase involved in cell wall biosynthesis
MNILMMTNTYTPFIGGVERSIEIFSALLREAGHKVVIVAPTYPHDAPGEKDVIRVPALQRFNGSDFSLQLPVPGILESALKGFVPDIVHSHHPYLVGDTALRIANMHRVPVVFTHHTFYERYTHYFPGDSPGFRRFVTVLATGYANLCDHVIAPSQSVKEELQRRGVIREISVIPTGIDLKFFRSGDCRRYREQAKIPPGGFVAGIVSRITPEKNINFLADAVARFMRKVPLAHFFVFGEGKSLPDIISFFDRLGLGDRCHAFGAVQGQALADAYMSMDLFAFASMTETQGMVLSEAMAAGLPVVALSATGTRDIVADGRTGFLVPNEDPGLFADALFKFYRMTCEERNRMRAGARQASATYDHRVCAGRLSDLYSSLVRLRWTEHPVADSLWNEARGWISAEWEIMTNMANATMAAMQSDRQEHARIRDPGPGTQDPEK